MYFALVGHDNKHKLFIGVGKFSIYIYIFFFFWGGGGAKPAMPTSILGGGGIAILQNVNTRMHAHTCM